MGGADDVKRVNASVVRSSTGFTLVEVMVAIFVLLIGVLGTVALSDGAARSTNINKAREEGTNVARDVIEATHTFQYSSITQASINGQLQAQTGLADDDPATAGYQVKRRGFTYTVVVSICTYDDPKDGMGAHDSSYCSDVGTAGAADANPSDYKRVSVNVSWVDARGTESVKQATLLRNNSRGPAINAMDTTAPSGNPTVTTGSAVGFTFMTSLTPAKVLWYVDGAYQGDLTSGISGSGTGPYTFSWSLNGACSTNAVMDGTYFVAVQAYDASDASPGQRSMTVNVNRCAPSQVLNLLGGRNPLFSKQVELNWDDNPEDDVLGYYVFRGIGSATPTQIASGPCSGLLTVSNCTEPEPSSTSTLSYYVKAVDRDPAGALRAGTASATLTSTTSNRAPAAPSIASATTYGTIYWSQTTDPDSGDSVDYYRVYRDGTGLANRYDVIDNVPAAGTSYVLWTDPNPGGTTHTYRVTSVDTHAAESSMSNSVTR
jgi:prepilin-type N-terminal cleavage/methylation domain-containing protein